MGLMGSTLRLAYERANHIVSNKTPFKFERGHSQIIFVESKVIVSQSNVNRFVL